MTELATAVNLYRDIPSAEEDTQVFCQTQVHIPFSHFYIPIRCQINATKKEITHNKINH